MKVAALLVMHVGLVGVAYADDKPDGIADTESRDANLEYRGPRSGFTFSVALGFGFSFGGDIGVGRGPAVAFRIGQVATRETIITFEIAGTGALHKPAMMSDTLTDTSLGLLAGVQSYTGERSSLWFRAGGGLDALSKNVMKDGSGGTSYFGVAGLVGAGLDLLRWGYLVGGVEMFAMTSVTRDGAKLQLGLQAAVSYY